MNEGHVNSVDTQGDVAVLLIDDEPLVLSTLGRILRQSGYRVIAVPTGAEAVRLVKEKCFQPDVVLLDMTIGDLPADTIVAELKQAEPSIRVLLISGYPLDDGATEVIDVGAHGYLQKPFSPDTLQQRIRELCHQPCTEKKPQ